MLGTDIMIPAGVRLDLFHGTARLPDEVTVPLVKSAGAADDEPYGAQIVGGPTEDLYIPRGEWREFRMPRKRPSRATHKLWIRRIRQMIPTVMESRWGKPVWVRLTNVSDGTGRCYKLSSVVLWIPKGELPREVGYVRLDSSNNNEWQVLTYAEGRDDTLLQKEKELYECWLAEESVLDHSGPDDRGDGMNSSCSVRMRDDSEASVAVGVDEETSGEPDTQPTEFSDVGDDEEDPAEDSVDILELTYISVMQEINAEIAAGDKGTDDDWYEHIPNKMELADYAHELAFLPDLTEPSSTVLDYTGPNVMNESLGERKLVEVLQRHEGIMIASGNALPPPAYGVVCDMDVQGHMPIKQRARRTPLRVLEKLYELLTGLLRASFITFSDSPWASPIVIVLKKNGVDIRLCIDYKRVNAVTTIMEYAMPLVDDLLTDMEAYLWFCSLDAASGFWAVMMTERARKVSAFVCALGHFEWRRMPFGLKNAPMIYQRMMYDALWGFVQPKGGWNEYSECIRLAEEDVERTKTEVTESSTRPRSKFEADRESASNPDPVSELVNSLIGDMFTNGEPGESSLVPVFDRRSFVDDICCGSETYDGCLSTLDRLLRRFTECRISVSFTKSIFVQSRVDFHSHEVVPEELRADAKKIKRVTEFSFPTSMKGMQSFLGALNYYSRFTQDFAVYAAASYRLKEEDFEPGGDLSVARQSFAKLQQKIGDAPILRHFDRQKDIHVTLFVNEWSLSSTLMQEHDGKIHPVRFCGRVLKEAEMNYHPAEKKVLALLLLLKTCYTQLGGRTIHVYTRFSTLEWVHTSKYLFGRTTQFAVMLSPWHLVVTRVKEKDCAFAQLLQAGLTSFVDLEDSLATVTPAHEGIFHRPHGPSVALR
ncbi:hypothetical protein PHMEG_00013096 [Phytophthora megakarya]|uniref:Reverse transcriptase/retrotransposon-derived protein RNase H-like domain-containing protein n=1 Tax=Phytophthora megakarya TaxID=4795 RepID=A0A225W987_9STRA|nr:hypothetical protein PHMEG_00013096 [Phytophthora megakarya]